MTSDRDSKEEERLRLAAADWFARLRGSPSEEVRDAFNEWLAADPDHRSAFARLEQRWDQSAFLRNSDLARSRNLTQAAAWHRRPDARAWGTAAAAAIALVLSLVVILRPAQTPQRLIVAREISNPGTAPRYTALADGSTILLQPNAVIAVRFTSKERRLRLLRGSARFAVAHDPARVFIVDAGRGMIIARGTLFDVTVDGPRVRVALLEGKVEVRPMPRVAAGGSGARILKPGQETTYGGGDAIETSAGVAAQVTSPRAMITFDALPLREAAEAISRRSGVAVSVDDAVAGTRLSGAFRADDPAGFAEAAADLFGLRAVRRDAGYVIEARDKSVG